MAKRGNPGYGKMENIRQNVDKFSPVFWQLMEEFAKSKRKDDKRFFMQEFNKIQTKMIPQKLAGGDEDDAPIQIQWQQLPSLIPPAAGPSVSTTASNAG
jgi:hypothetical protein